jgi:hypothetical protein
MHICFTICSEIWTTENSNRDSLDYAYLKPLVKRKLDVYKKLNVFHICRRLESGTT